MQILFLSTGKTKEEDNRRQHLSLMENVTGAKYILLGIYPRKISPSVHVVIFYFSLTGIRSRKKIIWSLTW